MERRVPPRELAVAVGVTALAVLAVTGLASLWATTGPGSRDILVTEMLVNVVLVMGLQVFIGTSGILSFGHMAFGAITGYVVAILAVPPDRKIGFLREAPAWLVELEYPVWVATAAGVLVALVVGAAVGAAVVRVGGLAATIITLALLFGVHEVVLNWSQVTGGGGGISFVPRLGGTWPVAVAAAAAAVIARGFRLARAGRWASAGQEDLLAAEASGIDMRRSWLLGFLLSVGIVAVGAALRVQVLGSISPSFFYFDLTLLTLTMLIVGGRRSVTGSLLGVVLITAGMELTRWLANVGSDLPVLSLVLRPGLSDLFLGGAMVGFMLMRPSGLLGDWELDEWAARRLGRGRAAPATTTPAEATAPHTGAGTAPGTAVGPGSDTGPGTAPGTAPDTGPGTALGTAPDTVAAGTPDAGRRAGPRRLEIDDVTVDFGGFRALADVTLEVHSDEVFGLIGPNGAGKTTLLNVITGLVEATRGSLHLDGRDLTGARSAAIAHAGLARTFQNLRLFTDLSVRENVAVATMVAERHRTAHPRLDTDELVRSAGLWDQRHRRAGELDYGSQRRLEIARAAAVAPEFLLLDEPTSGMSDPESAEMIQHVRDTAARLGAGVIVIDHDLHFITNACDRIAVLDHGAVIAVGTPAEIQADPAVIESYLGSERVLPS